MQTTRRLRRRVSNKAYAALGERRVIASLF
jgi:hypothetical protein